jgi:hypothetical protein
MKTLGGALGLLTAVFLFGLFTGGAAAGTVGTLRICQGCAGAGDLSRYEYVVLHSDQAGLIPTIKASNPRAKVLVYKNASATYTWAQSGGTDWARLPSGIGYVDADRNHPDWFLTDTSGRRIQFSDYGDMWMMDFGNPQYQQAWLQNVLADVQANGWDGVMIDDVNASQTYHLGGRTIAKYPTAAQQQEAMRSFLAAVGPGLTSRGALALPNIFVEWPSGPTIWSQWIGYTSGAVQEYWTKWGTGTTQQFTGSDWTYRQDFLRLTQQAGKIYLGVTYAPSTDLRSMEYARGSFLLDWDGGASALVFDPGATDPWNESWTRDLGLPSGARFAVGAAWRRNYSGGTVVVNPSTSTTTVQLGGSFVDTSGKTVTAVSLGPATAAVLKTATTSPPTATPTPDRIAPVVAITSPADSSRVPATFTVTATATDTGGVASVTFVIDGRTVCMVTSGPLVCTMTTSRGWHQVTVRAADVAGNVGQKSIRVKA